jgi:hypothetical protein
MAEDIPREQVVHVSMYGKGSELVCLQIEQVTGFTGYCHDMNIVQHF